MAAFRKRKDIPLKLLHQLKDGTTPLMPNLDTGSNIQQQTAATWREKTQLFYLRRQGEQPRKYLVLFVPRHPKYIKSAVQIYQMFLVLTGRSHRIWFSRCGDCRPAMSEMISVNCTRWSKSSGKSSYKKWRLRWNQKMNKTAWDLKRWKKIVAIQSLISKIRPFSVTHLFQNHPVCENVLRHLLTGNGQYRLYR